MKNKGITLIVLVITIVILIIIAGVSILAVLGDEGIFKTAKKAADETKIAEAKEKIILAVFNSYGENGEIDNERLKNNLNNIEGINPKITEVTFDLHVNIETYRYSITQQGKVTYLGKNVIEKDVIEIGKEYKYQYTGEYQEFEVQQSGYYKIECWGASGGYSRADGSIGAAGGKGGYTSGQIYFEKGEKLYIYVGGQGADASVGKDSTAGYNGGGLGTWDKTDNEAAGAGGGATDIRLVSREWNNFESLKSRIMVAAGGAGASWKTAGGAGGGIVGFSNRANSKPGTQTTGYKFGIGQDGYGTGNGDGVGGSGGGYYGGTTSNIADSREAGAGGSSFISGYSECNAITEDSIEDNIIHTNQPNHYSGKIFSECTILSGKDTISSTTGFETTVGNSGNGYVRIRFIKS